MKIQRIFINGNTHFPPAINILKLPSIIILKKLVIFNRIMKHI